MEGAVCEDNSARVEKKNSERARECQSSSSDLADKEEDFTHRQSSKHYKKRRRKKVI